MAVLDQFREIDAARMGEVQGAIVNALLPFTDNTHPLLLLLALTRCARVLLRKAPLEAQKELLPVVHAYLGGKTQPPGAHALLWLPPGPERNN